MQLEGLPGSDRSRSLTCCLTDMAELLGWKWKEASADVQMFTSSERNLTALLFSECDGRSVPNLK